VSGPYVLQTRWRHPLGPRPGPTPEDWSAWEDKKAHRGLVLTFRTAEAARAWMADEAPGIRERLWRRRGVQLEFRAVSLTGEEEILGQEPTPLPDPCDGCGRLHPPAPRWIHAVGRAKLAVVILAVGLPLVLFAGMGPVDVLAVAGGMTVALGVFWLLDRADRRGGWVGCIPRAVYTLVPVAGLALLTWSFTSTGDHLWAAASAMLAGLAAWAAFADWRRAYRRWLERRRTPTAAS
jgi:hypothetical protein